MKAKLLYDNAPQIRQAIMSAPALQIFLEDWLATERSSCEDQSDEKEIFRSQGRIGVLKRLVGLKKELDDCLNRQVQKPGTGA